MKPNASARSGKAQEALAGTMITCGANSRYTLWTSMGLKNVTLNSTSSYAAHDVTVWWKFDFNAMTSVVLNGTNASSSGVVIAAYQVWITVCLFSNGSAVWYSCSNAALRGAGFHGESLANQSSNQTIVGVRHATVSGRAWSSTQVVTMTTWVMAELTFFPDLAPIPDGTILTASVDLSHADGFGCRMLSVDET